MEERKIVMKDKIGFVWTPLFFMMFLYEYFAPTINICGSVGNITGQMWFMWFMMGLSSSGKYVEWIEKTMESKK